MAYRTYPSNGDAAPLDAEYVTAVDDPNLPNDKVAVGVDPISVAVVGNEIRISANLPFNTGSTILSSNTVLDPDTDPSSFAIDGASSGFTITIPDPTPSSMDGKEYIFKRNDSNINEVEIVSAVGNIDNVPALYLMGTDAMFKLKVIAQVWRLVSWYQGQGSMLFDADVTLKPGYVETVLINCTSGNVEVTLENVAGTIFDYTHSIVKLDSTSNVINLPDTISGMANRVIADQYASMTVRGSADLGAWFIK